MIIRKNNLFSILLLPLIILTVGCKKQNYKAVPIAHLTNEIKNVKKTFAQDFELHDKYTEGKISEKDFAINLKKIITTKHQDYYKTLTFFQHLKNPAFYSYKFLYYVDISDKSGLKLLDIAQSEHSEIDEVLKSELKKLSFALFSLSQTTVNFEEYKKEQLYYDIARTTTSICI